MKKIFICKFVLVILFFLFLKTVFAQTNGLIISEIMYDPAGSDDKHEWVEIQNAGASTVNIITGSSSSAWRFYDGSNHTLQFYQGASALEPGVFLILADDPATFLADHPGFGATLYKTSLSLNNDTDTLKLSLDGGKTWVNEISYNKDSGASSNNYSLEKEGSSLRQSYILGGTSGRANSTVADKPVYSREVIINEILPYPSTGTNDEFIELKNIGGTEIDLIGWQLDDKADSGSSAYAISTSRQGGTKIAPGGFLVFSKPETSLALNDEGDDVRLLWPDGQEINKVSYPKAAKGSSYSRSNDVSWFWTSSITLGNENASNSSNPAATANVTTPASTASASTSSTPAALVPAIEALPSSNVPFSQSQTSSSTNSSNREENERSTSTKKKSLARTIPKSADEQEKQENEELAKKLTAEVKGVKTTTETGARSLFAPYKTSVKMVIITSILFLGLLILEGILRWQRQKTKSER